MLIIYYYLYVPYFLSGSRRSYCWQRRTAEVEFVLGMESGIIPVEVKAGRIRKSKSLRVYEERYKPEFSILLNACLPEQKGQRVYLPLYMAERLFTLFAGK